MLNDRVGLAQAFGLGKSTHGELLTIPPSNLSPPSSEKSGLWRKLLGLSCCSDESNCN